MSTAFFRKFPKYQKNFEMLLNTLKYSRILTCYFAKIMEEI